MESIIVTITGWAVHQTLNPKSCLLLHSRELAVTILCSGWLESRSRQGDRGEEIHAELKGISGSSLAILQGLFSETVWLWLLSYSILTPCRVDVRDKFGRSLELGDIRFIPHWLLRVATRPSGIQRHGVGNTIMPHSSAYI